LFGDSLVAFTFSFALSQLDDDDTFVSVVGAADVTFGVAAGALGAIGVSAASFLDVIGCT
jgi:hypothetical protein